MLRSFNLTELLSSTNQFFQQTKTGGLLKVPEGLLNKVEEWAVSSYCYWIKEGCRKKYAQQTVYREGEIKKVRELQGLVKNFLTLIENNDWDGVFAWFEDGVFNSLGSFDPEEWDEVSDGLGVYNPDNPVLRVTLTEEKTGVYDIELLILGELERFSGLAKEQVIQVLKRNKKDLVRLLEDFLTLELRLSDPQKSRMLAFLVGYCARLVTVPVRPEVFVFPLNSVGGFEGENRSVKLESIFIGNSNNASKIYDREAWRGLWRAEKEDKRQEILGKIMVFRDISKDLRELNLERLEKYLSELKETVRHELQHSIQTLYQTYKELSEEGGLPGGKYRNPNVDPHGQEVTDPEKTKREGERLDRDIHPLRDIEFYTRLTDAVGNFNRIKSMFPLFLHSELLRAFVGEIDQRTFITTARILLAEWAEQNEGQFPKNKNKLMDDFLSAYSKVQMQPGFQFFKELKKSQSPKYQKAVKEFVKAVNL